MYHELTDRLKYGTLFFCYKFLTEYNLFVKT